MISLSQILRGTMKSVKDKSRNVRTVRVKTARDADGRIFYRLKIGSRSKRKFRNVVIVLYVKKFSPSRIKRAPAWISCDCEFFKYYCERALVKQGSSSIIHTRDYDPARKVTKREVNPRNIPMMCGHILASLKVLSKLPLEKGKIPLKIEVNLSLPEAEKRRA